MFSINKIKPILVLGSFLELSVAIAAPKENQPADDITKCNERCIDKNFKGQDLSTATGQHRSYWGSDFSDTKLPKDMALVDLSGCNLAGANAEGVNLAGSKFAGVYIDDRTSFKNAILHGVARLENAHYPKCGTTLNDNQFDVAGQIKGIPMTSEEIAALLSNGLKPCDSRITETKIIYANSNLLSL